MRPNYCKTENNEILDFYVDADWVSDSQNNKSTSRHVIRFFGNIVILKSRKQALHNLRSM